MNLCKFGQNPSILLRRQSADKRLGRRDPALKTIGPPYGGGHKYVSTYTKDTLKQRSAKDSSNDAYAMSLHFLFLISLIKAHVVGTHLNCTDKPMQFQWVPTTYAFMKK